MGNLWNVLDWWRTRAYLMREGEYRNQIQVLKPTRKERLRLPSIKPLKAEGNGVRHVLNDPEVFMRKRR